jgi:hypothetical protein
VSSQGLRTLGKTSVLLPIIGIIYAFQKLAYLYQYDNILKHKIQVANRIKENFSKCDRTSYKSVCGEVLATGAFFNPFCL